MLLRQTNKQLTFDAQRIIGFNMPLMEAMGGEMVFMQRLARTGKLAQADFAVAVGGGRARHFACEVGVVQGGTNLVEAFVALNAQGSDGGIVVSEDSVPAVVPSTANRRGNPSWPT